MKKIFLILSIAILFSLAIFAQQTYKVGDSIEFECNCFGPTEWVKGTVEEVQGNAYRIRYGKGRNAYRNGIETGSIRKIGAGVETAKQNDLRQQFLKEAYQYQQSVLYLMQVHNVNLTAGSGAYRPPVRADDWAKLKTDLASLDTLCKSKYAGMTNGTPYGDALDLRQLPATWCEIAAKRVEYETRGRQMAAGDQFNPFLEGMISKVQEVIDEPKVFITEDIQLLMYEREKWRALQSPKFLKNFAAMGVAMPSDFFAKVEAKSDELKLKNEREAPSRSFLMPKQKDATVESFIRGRYAALKKGVQILKLGLDDGSWVIHRNSLGVPLSQTKVARLLVKIPNRPLCQEQSIAVERKYTRGALGSMVVEGDLGESGLFMKCE